MTSQLDFESLSLYERVSRSKSFENIHFNGPTMDEIEVIDDEERAEQVASDILSSQVEFCGFDCEWYRGRNVGKLLNYKNLLFLQAMLAAENL